jgi:hypothetical protein
MLTSGPVDSFREVNEMNAIGDTMSIRPHISTADVVYL